MRSDTSSSKTNSQAKVIRPLLRFLRTALIGLVGAWLAVIIWHGVNGDLGIAKIHASIYPSASGKTVLHFPPLGWVSAKTHTGPVRIDLAISEVHIKETAQWLKQHKTPQETVNLVERGVEAIALRLARLAIVVAALGALLACLLFRVGWKHTLCGIAIGVVAVAAPLGLAARTYNTAAFSDPELGGELARAPHLLNIAQRAWENNSGLVEHIPRIAERTVALYQQLEHTGYDRMSNPRSYYHVLLVSDLHNNPIAVRFALDLARTYDAKLVLIAGDLTDLGHPLESELLAGLKKFRIPVVAVAGNHDSNATMSALRDISGVTMLDNGQMVHKAHLSIMGYGDPASKRADTGSVDTSARQLHRLSSRIDVRLGSVPPPDILMVHNNDVARSAAGRVPLIVEGHLHNAFISNRRGSVLVNPGTAGAAGIRYFSSEKKPAYSAAVLHFAPGARPRLRMVDIIKMELPSGDFSVTRQNVTPRM